MIMLDIPASEAGSIDSLLQHVFFYSIRMASIDILWVLEDTCIGVRGSRCKRRKAEPGIKKH